MLYVCNVEEAVGRHRQRTIRARSRRARKRRGRGRRSSISAKIESGDRRAAAEPSAQTFSTRSAWRSPASTALIRAGYELLHLVTYLHRRAEGGARLDHRRTAPRAPQAAGVIHTDFEQRLHPRRDHRLRRLRRVRRRGRRARSRQDAAGRQGLRGRRRRRDAFPLRDLTVQPAPCSKLHWEDFTARRGRRVRAAAGDARGDHRVRRRIRSAADASRRGGRARHHAGRACGAPAGTAAAC